jgi:glycosyltransferase involved in cell wall biosynthesis
MDRVMPSTWVELDIVVPVHNEAHLVADSVRRLHAHLTGWPSWRITIAENGSTDGTLAEARRLADELPGVRVVSAEGAGRGLALRTAWSSSEASIVAYTDVDLSTGLDALEELVGELRSGRADIAIGSRLAPESRIVRGFKREVISRCYNALLRVVLGTSFGDAQCGFKALRTDVAASLLPEVEDNGWFFDTELLVLAALEGLRIHEVPVDWVDDPDSRVRILRTAWQDLRGVARVRRRHGRIPRYRRA